MTFTYHQDPAHGWIEVPLDIVSELGIAERISSYSYRSNERNMAYLEEDRDAHLFIKAYEQSHGRPPAIAEHHLDAPHWIRQLPMYVEPSQQ